MAAEQGDLLSCCTLPPNWQPMTSEVELIELTQGSDEYTSVARKVNNTLSIPINSVVRVQNPYLFGCYCLKKLEYETKNIIVREIELFHCTGNSNIDSITANNLDWRKCFRSKFGKGVSFSPSAEYANRYANKNIGAERALILTNVLVGSEVQGSELMYIPPEFHDTSYGKWHNRTMVYVKYNDYEFYPSYVAYYTDPSSSHLSYRQFPDYRFNFYDSYDYDNDDYIDSYYHIDDFSDD